MSLRTVNYGCDKHQSPTIFTDGTVDSLDTHRHTCRLELHTVAEHQPEQKKTKHMLGKAKVCGEQVKARLLLSYLVRQNGVHSKMMNITAGFIPTVLYRHLQFALQMHQVGHRFQCVCTLLT